MRKLLFASVITVMALPGLANANTINGSLWHVPEFVVDFSGTGAIPGNVPGTTPDVTFDVASPFDFDKTSATVTDWLGSSSAFNIVENTAGTLASLMDGGGVGTIVNFLGSVSVTNGQQFTVTHDDGLSLIIGSTLVISAPGPTSPTTGTYTYTGATGTFPFQLVYSECCGGPAVLQVDLPLSAVPLPGALPLFAGGLGLLGFLARRRRKPMTEAFA